MTYNSRGKYSVLTVTVTKPKTKKNKNKPKPLVSVIYVLEPQS